MMYRIVSYRHVHCHFEMVLEAAGIGGCRSREPGWGGGMYYVTYWLPTLTLLCGVATQLAIDRCDMSQSSLVLLASIPRSRRSTCPDVCTARSRLG